MVNDPGVEIDQFRYIEIQPETSDLSTRLWGITIGEQRINSEV